MHRSRSRPRPRGRDARAPIPLLAGFALFVATLAYLVAASLSRRQAPTFPPSPLSRSRPASWTRAGDTLTIDASDGDRWHRASLRLGRPLAPDDTTPWQVAARRYRITVDGALADLGTVPFERAAIRPATRFVPSTPREMENEAIRRWYRYSLVTHLLTPNRHVYALRAADGTAWKLEVLGYYCPGLAPGCVTLRYAPLDAGVSAASGAHIQGSSADGP